MMEKAPCPHLVSVIIPAYNEEPSIIELYDRIRDVLVNIASFEVLFIDDGSTDGTLSVMLSLHDKYDNVTVIQHRNNVGKSLALMNGFKAAKGDVAITLDADLQDQPEEIPGFLDLINQGYDLVVGWRINRQDRKSRNLISTVYNAIIRFFIKLPTHDINCGFKAIRSEMYRRLELTGDMHRIIPALVKALGGKVTEYPVAHAPRHYGSSRYNLLRYRGILDIIAFLASHAVRYRPFHFFSELGMVFIGLLIICLGGNTLLTLWPDMLDNQDLVRLLSNFTLIGSICTFILGVIMPVLGLVMEVLLRQFPLAKQYERLVFKRFPAGRDKNI